MTAPNRYLIEGLDDQQLAFLSSAGFPTFDEYVKEPDKYRETWDEVFGSIEDGPALLREMTKGKHVLKVCGKKVESIGQAMRVAKDMGFIARHLTYNVNLESVGGGQYIHHIDIIPKKNFEVSGE